LAPLKNSTFRSIFFGSQLSSLGWLMQTVALSWLMATVSTLLLDPSPPLQEKVNVVLPA